MISGKIGTLASITFVVLLGLMIALVRFDSPPTVRSSPLPSPKAIVSLGATYSHVIEKPFPAIDVNSDARRFLAWQIAVAREEVYSGQWSSSEFEAWKTAALPQWNWPRPETKALKISTLRPAIAPGQWTGDELMAWLIIESGKGEMYFHYCQPKPSAITNSDWTLKAASFVEDNPTAVSYHLLMYLRSMHPDVYECLDRDLRAKVLVSALMNSPCNDWGYLGEPNFDHKAAQVLLSLGRPALPYLVQQLRNENHAGLFGGEEATISWMEEWRRCDYAYRYIMLILGRQPTFHPNPRERDKPILRLMAELSQDA